MERLTENLMTPKQVVERYGVLLGIRSTKTLWQWRKDGRLAFFRIGKRVLISTEQVEEFLKGCERSVA